MTVIPATDRLLWHNPGRFFGFGGQYDGAS